MNLDITESISKVNASNFNRMMEKYQNEQEVVQGQISAYEEVRAEEKDKRSLAEKVADLFIHYGEFDQLTPGLLNTLIDKITVSEPYVLDGRFKQDVTIYYRYIGALDTLRNDSTRFYKSEKCAQASQKRAARQMEQRIAAVAEEGKKEQAALPAEEKALGAQVEPASVHRPQFSLRPSQQKDISLNRKTDAGRG